MNKLLLSLLLLGITLTGNSLHHTNGNPSKENSNALSFLLPPATTDYYTLAPGGDMTSNIWSKTSHVGSNCGCAPCICSPCDIPANAVIYIAHPVTVNCDIVIGSNSTIIIESGGALIVTGNGSITGTGNFQVDAGGSVDVSGDLTLSGTGDVTLNGDITVGGDLDISGAATFCGSGSVVVTGSVTGIPDPCFTGFLPIELLSFTATLKQQLVDIRWSTATETNNAYFTVERSMDAQNWTIVGTQNGAGNSNSVLYYKDLDESPLKGTSYYRLKQTDFDGAYTYSPVAVVNNLQDGPELVVYPNPNDGTFFTAELGGFDSETVHVTVQNLLGKKCYDASLVVIDHKTHLKFGSNTLAPGAYFITVSSGSKKVSKKFIVR